MKLIPVSAVIPWCSSPLPRYYCRVCPRYLHYRGKIFQFVPTTAVLPQITYGAVSTQMTRLDFDLSAIRLAGRGYVDVGVHIGVMTSRHSGRRGRLFLAFVYGDHFVCVNDDYSVRQVPLSTASAAPIRRSLCWQKSSLALACLRGTLFLHLKDGTLSLDTFKLITFCLLH